MLENRTKKVLREGKVVFGTMITEFGSPETSRLLAAGGFDFAMVDTEHSPFSLETVIEFVRTAKTTQLTLLARVPTPDYFHVARMLDLGVHGVMIPHVEEVNQVKMAIGAAKYPPLGIRSYGVRSIITDYKPSTVKEQITQLNEDTMVIIQIESVKAIDDIDRLVSIEGVDAAIIGPHDLSISLGCPGELEHRLMDEAVQKVLDACIKRRVAAGIHLRAMDAVLKWRERGMTMLMYSNDGGLLLSACKEAVTKFKNSLR